MKEFMIGLLFVLLSVVTPACGSDAGERLEVVTTLFPTFDFARQAGGDKVNVTLLLPPGVEPHTYEPKPSDIVRISKADVFIHTGAQMEPWVSGLLRGVAAPDLLVVDSSRGVPSLSGDPHIWLDLGNACMMAGTIAEAMAQRSPQNREYFLENARRYCAQLAELDTRFQSALSSCRFSRVIFAGHFPFGYLAKRYGLGYDSPYAGFSPDAEPTPKAIAKLIDALKASGMKYVYFEELLDPKVARTVAAETRATPVMLHAGHNVSREDMARGVTYLEIMEDTLKKLRAGLECQ
jgi:zinc transport system substrate-binding protein